MSFIISGQVKFDQLCLQACAYPKGGEAGGLENKKTIGFLSKTGPDPLENRKATNQASIQLWAIIGPPAKCLNGPLFGI